MSISTLTDAIRIFSGRRLHHPIYLIYFITSQCMGHCRHCFYWDHINQAESLLSIEEIDKIAASMGRIYQLILTGGEPFFREDVADLAERFYIYNNLYHLSVATSGYHPERVEKAVKILLKKCPGLKITIGLPVEGTETLNDEIRGIQGFYKRTVETLSRLKKIQQHAPQLNILIDLTISSFNSDRLLEIYDHLLNDLKPDLINAILTRGNSRDPDAKKIDTNEVAKLFALMEEDIRKGRIKGYGFLSKWLHAKDIVLRQTALDIFQNHTYHLPCQAGRTAGVLMPEGDVYACELREKPIGNLRAFDYNFPALWKSENATAIRREILDTRCSCHHQCFLSNTLFWNLKAWPDIVREWMKIRGRNR
ncbi:MAG TPA: radical SAM/SPASM domain-containing protein [Smithella sp.]|nr:radical SAM/SPASM domain-containing protein [Smithella sp.]